MLPSFIVAWECCCCKMSSLCQKVRKKEREREVVIIERAPFGVFEEREGSLIRWVGISNHH